MLLPLGGVWTNLCSFPYEGKGDRRRKAVVDEVNEGDRRRKAAVEEVNEGDRRRKAAVEEVVERIRTSLSNR